MQKEHPPTHLIRSRDGDYLRGRILEMDDRRLLVEVRLETREIPRNRISRIIWLHPEQLDKPSQPSKTITGSSAAQAQVILEDGIRLSFHPESLSESILSGTSEAIGPCRVALSGVDQLLIGTAIDEAATRAAYQQWKLQYALEPKFVQDEKNGSPDGDSNGTESSLVGKPAPDFELDTIGGDRFRLSEHKGKIIVLDFWATWCSFCLQTMPELVRLHHDSAGRDVQVVAVNLEEAPDQISAMLERHKWQIPVALDREGVVAAKYGVTAIPQTIIINRDGTVARHFIGGDSKLGKKLVESVNGLISAPGPKKTPAPTR